MSETTVTRGTPGSCRSALFVDFDNVYIGLQKQEPELARLFASQPSRWVEWLQANLQIPAGSWLSQERRILVRRCYLNPQSFGTWRAYFIRNGFETIDCPPLTAHGKTSADVHMVLDIVDFLSGDTVFDEFIIMSADADFTPVLLKLRKHDRRSIVLAIGPSSSAYAAASDLVIDQEAFRDFLLASDVLPVRSPELAPAVLPQDSAVVQREGVSRTVREVLSRSSTPVSLAALADAIRSRHSDISADWGGHGSFSAMLAELDLANLSRATSGPGYIYDPDRHVVPVSEFVKVDLFESEDPVLRDLASRVSDLTETPYLLPASYAELFSILADEINSNGYQMTRVSKAVRDECQKRGLSVGRQPINFILQGIAFSGHRFGRAVEVAKELASAFRRNTLNLCARNQVNLSSDEERMVSVWLVGEESASVTDERADAPENEDPQLTVLGDPPFVS